MATFDIEKFKELGLIAKDTDGSLAKMKQSLSDVNGLVQTLDVTLSATNATAKAFDATAKVIGTLPAQLSEFTEELRKSTGFNEEYRKSISKTREDLLNLGAETSRFGVTNKENLKTLRELAKENVRLLPIFEKNAVGLVRFSARMKAFGVDTKTSAGLIGTLTSNLDMTSGQLDETRRSLVSFANQTGQSVEKVVRDYSSSIKSFMDFLSPQEMNRSFMQFQVMARRMGTEANTLYGLATKFDTIEGAQQLGARLNQTFSALGIEFNALAIQEMSPRQRIDYIAGKTREALKRARAMGGREGRLIVRSLEGAGLGDIATIRALGAEGGMRRAGAFEMGGGMVRPMTAAREAGLARISNFENIARAEAEERSKVLIRQTEIFKRLNRPGGPIDDLSGFVINLEEKLKPAKDIVAQAALDEASKRFGKAAKVALDALEGAVKVGPAIANKLRKLGVQGVTAQTTFLEVANKMKFVIDGLAEQQKKKAGEAAAIATGKGMAGGTVAALTSAETQALKGVAKYIINQQKSKTLSGASATEPD
mgnify:CR=1 FL=1